MKCPLCRNVCNSVYAGVIKTLNQNLMLLRHQMTQEYIKQGDTSTARIIRKQTKSPYADLVPHPRKRGWSSDSQAEHQSPTRPSTVARTNQRRQKRCLTQSALSVSEPQEKSTRAPRAPSQHSHYRTPPWPPRSPRSIAPPLNSSQNSWQFALH